MSPTRLVWHAVLCSPLPSTLREAGRWETMPLVIARHPEQRRHLFLGFFRNRSHFGILLALLGLLFARRRPGVAVAAALPYMAMNTDAASIRGIRAAARHAIHLPARAALDAAQTLATIRHAIRHRVPMARCRCGSRCSIPPTGLRSGVARNGWPTISRHPSSSVGTT